MAKQKYSNQHIIAICGTLDKNEDEEYIVTVEDKNFVKEFRLTEVLDQMIGAIVSVSSVDELC